MKLKKMIRLPMKNIPKIYHHTIFLCQSIDKLVEIISICATQFVYIVFCEERIFSTNFFVVSWSKTFQRAILYCVRTY